MIHYCQRKHRKCKSLLSSQGVHEDSCRVSEGVGHSCCVWQGIKQSGPKDHGIALPRGELLGSNSHLRSRQEDLGLHHSLGKKLGEKYRGTRVMGCFRVNKLVSGNIPGHRRAATCTNRTALAVHLSRANHDTLDQQLFMDQEPFPFNHLPPGKHPVLEDKRGTCTDIWHLLPATLKGNDLP